jgi:hypothetical protein
LSPAFLVDDASVAFEEGIYLRLERFGEHPPGSIAGDFVEGDTRPASFVAIW